MTLWGVSAPRQPVVLPEMWTNVAGGIWCRITQNIRMSNRTYTKYESVQIRTAWLGRRTPSSHTTENLATASLSAAKYRPF